MKALSIHPAYVEQILQGEKTIECRSWDTLYRGDILICSTAKKRKGTISGHALCVVRLDNIVPFAEQHCKAACMQSYEFSIGMYAWMLKDIRYIKPIPIKGRLSLWNYTGEIEYLPEDMTPEELEEIWKQLRT